MKRVLFLSLLFAAVLAFAGCGANKDDNIAVINGEDGPTVIFSAGKTGEQNTEEPASEEDEEEPNLEPETITEEQALAAVKNYCFEQNPDLKEMESSDEYTVYWEVESSSDEQIVVLFRSYTAALVRYYIDSYSGDTYVTEFVPGITSEEEKTDESFNVKDYMNN